MNKIYAYLKAKLFKRSTDEQIFRSILVGLALVVALLALLLVFLVL